ncbi:hypothetical protein KBTX_01527 [wastewater metagenome]|uniref:NADPH-dependent FMN reductase-like domain-containing protein n=2 Tax=unclassified sequences TaxID=12908 RepID=A0A5B8RB78_9ZZZZ|nr:NAD(P)H-dependent oxidoreductase [Arhodomonas sp. KWT]QEA05208.1 hypothetical protein KBTEX_01527 [uncultured organism]
MTTPRILAFAASTRTGSFNARLLDAAVRHLRDAGAEVTDISLADYDMPIYNGDIEADDGVPEAAGRLHERFRTHDGIFIASPEYNANATPLLVNSLAWLSRVQENGGAGAAFGQPVFALGSASPGGFGGYRGLMALRHMLELQLGARVLPQMVSVAGAHEGFDSDGEIVAEFPRKMLKAVVDSLVKTAG